jgi:hypothetical protein
MNSPVDSGLSEDDPLEGGGTTCVPPSGTQSPVLNHRYSITALPLRLPHRARSPAEVCGAVSTSELPKTYSSGATQRSLGELSFLPVQTEHLISVNRSGCSSTFNPVRFCVLLNIKLLCDVTLFLAASAKRVHQLAVLVQFSVTTSQSLLGRLLRTQPVVGRACGASLFPESDERFCVQWQISTPYSWLTFLAHFHCPYLL